MTAGRIQHLHSPWNVHERINKVTSKYVVFVWRHSTTINWSTASNKGKPMRGQEFLTLWRVVDRVISASKKNENRLALLIVTQPCYVGDIHHAQPLDVACYLVFAQQLVQTNNKKPNKGTNSCSFVTEIHRFPADSPHKKTVLRNATRLIVPWILRLYAITQTLTRLRRHVVVQGCVIWVFAVLGHQDYGNVWKHLEAD